MTSVMGSSVVAVTAAPDPADGFASLLRQRATSSQRELVPAAAA